MTLKLLPTLLLISLLAIGLASPTPASAKSKPKGTVPSVIVSVDVKARTITVKRGFKAQTKVDNEDPHNIDKFTVPPSTPVTINGLKSEFGALKRGMQVKVDVGMDRLIAAGIDAADAGPKPTPTPKPTGGKKKKSNVKAAFQKIARDKIMAVTPGTISVAHLGGNEVKTYKITSLTKITIGGEPGSVQGLAKGMDVSIAIGMDPTTAATIDADEAD